MYAVFLGKNLDRIKRFWRQVIGVGTGLFIFLAAYSSANAVLGNTSNAPGLAFVFVFLFTPICLVVYELGHAFAAAILGWRVHLIVVSRVGYRPKVRKSSYGNEAFGAGRRNWVLATPAPGQDWERGWPFVVLGGPLANLLVSGLWYEIARNIPDTRWSGFWGGLTFVSFILGIANLLPFWGPMERKSDGAQLLNIAIGRPVDALTRCFARIFGLWFDGVRPKDWDPQLIAEVEANLASTKKRATCEWILVSHYLSGGKLKRARDLLDQSASKHPAFPIEHAFLIGLLDKDADRASAILDTVPARLRDSSFTYWRAKAVIHGLRGETAEARLAVQQARHKAKKTGATPDGDDNLLFAALEDGKPLPQFEPV